jgi:hypothetical protein
MHLNLYQIVEGMNQVNFFPSMIKEVNHQEAPDILVIKKKEGGSKSPKSEEACLLARSSPKDNLYHF